MEKQNSNHLPRMCNNLKKIRENDSSCDVQITFGQSDPTVIKAHKNILAAGNDCFYNYFYGGSATVEKFDVEEIIFIGGDPKAMNEYIDYLYTSKIHISDSNVKQLLKIGVFLSDEWIKESCKEFLLENLNNSNFYDLWNFADSITDKDFTESIGEFFIENISKISEDDFNFLALTTDKIDFILKKNFKNPYNEKLVLSALLRWTKFDEVKRKESFNRWIIEFDLKKFDKKSLVFLAKEKLIKENFIALQNLTEALLLCINLQTSDVIYALGVPSEAKQISVLRPYHPHGSMNLKMIPPSSHFLPQAANIARYEESVFVLGRQNESDTASFWLYDGQEEKWKQLSAPKRKKACDYNIIAYKDTVFNLAFNGVQRYDLAENRWTFQSYSQYTNCEICDVAANQTRNIFYLRENTASKQSSICRVDLRCANLANKNIIELSASSGSLTGLACLKDHHLYVSSDKSSRLKLYDVRNMQNFVSETSEMPNQSFPGPGHSLTTFENRIYLFDTNKSNDVMIYNPSDKNWNYCVPLNGNFSHIRTT